jgi:hypothetical protein
MVGIEVDGESQFLIGGVITFVGKGLLLETYIRWSLYAH